MQTHSQERHLPRTHARAHTHTHTHARARARRALSSKRQSLSLHTQRREHVGKRPSFFIAREPDAELSRREGHRDSSSHISVPREPTDMYEYFNLYVCVCGENPQTCTNILICMYVCLWREPTDMYEYFSLYVCVCGENPQTCTNISIYIISRVDR